MCKFSSISLNLMLEIKRFRCYKANIEKDKKGQQLLGIKPRISGLSLPLRCDNQPLQSSVHTAQVVPNASVAHFAATQHVLSEFIRGLLENETC